MPTPMNGAEIGKVIGISRQAVSYNIKKSMRKMYKYILSSGMADTPFDAVLVLMNVLGINKGDTEDIRSFINLFDMNIREEIENDAVLIYGDRIRK